MRDTLWSIAVMILVCACSPPPGDGNVSPPNASNDLTAPTVPGNLTATATSTSQINLAWQASTDNIAVTGYSIYRCNGNGCSPTTKVGGSVTSGTTFSDIGLTANTAYTYAVTAFDAAANESAKSTPVGMTTLAQNDTTPPIAPSNLSATPISANQINLSWGASTDNVGVTEYTIRRCTGASCTPTTVIGTVTSGTTFQSMGLTASTTYRYAVIASDAAGNDSAASNTATAATTAATDTSAPTVPTGLTATATSSSQINLAWQASTDNVGVTEYSIYRCSGNGCVPSGPIGTVSSGTTFQNTGLAAGTTYTYAVTASDAAGNDSAFSLRATATTPAPTDTSAPTVPTGLTATATSTSQINLAWQASTDNVGVTGYTIRRCTGVSCTPTTTIINTVTSGTTFQNTGLTASTTYTYTVSARDAAGNDSAASNTATAATTAATDTSAPTVPTGLTATATSSSQINLAWQASTDNVGVTGYSIYRCSGAGCSPATNVGTATSGTSFSNTGLTASTTYTYAVTASDAVGNESAKSTLAAATTSPVAGSTTFTFVGAGDIASSGSNDERTATLLDTVVAADPNTIVFTLGDNAYSDGTTSDFTNYYQPTWGRHKARTRPALGNHDYHVAGAADYLNYFCPTSGPCVFPGGTKQLYYSYDLGDWHIVSLNSEADTSAGSAQLQWLQTDLAAHPTSCVLAYWHKPLFSSGSTHGNDSNMKPFWDELYAAKADLVLSGHEHNYERFAKQNPGGAADPNGIREFIIGTGGVGSYSFGSAIPNSQVRFSGGFGVVKFTLRTDSYDWTFIPAAGTTFNDSGSNTCNK